MSQQRRGRIDALADRSAGSSPVSPIDETAPFAGSSHDQANERAVPEGDRRETAPVYCASPAAIEAAARAYPGNDAALLADALVACHDPALGLDRSVCLRDVVEHLSALTTPGARFYAQRLEREFAPSPQPPTVGGTPA